MKSITLLTLLAATLAVTACGGDKSKKMADGVVTENDFENTAGWGVDPTLLSKAQAHSGIYSISVDPTHEFSLTYENSLGQMKAQKFTKVHLHAWVYLLSAQSNGILGMQVTDPSQGNKAIGGDDINLGETVKQYNKWVEVDKDLLLPANVTSANHIKVFLWRGAAQQPIFADDIRISIPE
jgi:hypothetical protein